MERLIVKKEALGRVGRLGDLYNAQKDAFCGVSVYPANIPISLKVSALQCSESVHAMESNQLSVKYSKLIKDTDLQISVLAGLVPLKGSARFLTSEQNPNSVVHSLLVSTKTKCDKLLLPDKNLNETFVFPAIQSTGATHLVVGIDWGANTVLSVSYDKTNEQTKTNSVHSRKRSSNFTTLAEHIQHLKHTCSQRSKYFIEWFIDVSPGNAPQTICEALPYICMIQNAVNDTTKDYAIPVLYHLLPVEKFRQFQFRKKNFNFMIPKAISDPTVNRRILNFYFQLQLAEQLLFKFYDAGKTYACFQLHEMETIARKKYLFEVYQLFFKKRFVNTLLQSRKGNSTMQVLLDIFEKTDTTSPVNVLESLNSWSLMDKLEKKIEFVKLLQTKGAKYIGWYGSLEDEIALIEQGTCVTFYFSENTKSKRLDHWFHSKYRFLQMLKEHANSGSHYKLIAVDCDLNPQYTPKNFEFPFIRVQEIRNGTAGNCTSYDIKYEPVSISYTSTVAVSVFFEPAQKIEFKTPCPGQHCTSTNSYEWKCAECMSPLAYGYDNNVYCDCGKASVLSLKFKCTAVRHGNEFTQFHESKLLQHLADLQPRTTINILLLGETGVGKSTWINSFINYVHYESLNDARENHLYTLISSKITHFNDKCEEIEIITTTSDSNEQFIVGESATQEPRCYPIKVQNFVYNIIDTPGVGDTRGTEQDSRNLENILNILSNYEEVHGICILLKPNNARLNLTFRFCIKELLAYLHKDASQNLLYCFTNCRATSFRPGETLPALKKLLRQMHMEISPEQIYCFDSESYRFLAGINNAVSFSEEDVTNFNCSWTKSKNEAIRMLEYISKLPPHPIQNTINLNHCRQLVLQLNRPFVEISQIIQVNKETVEMEVQNILHAKNNIHCLLKQQFVTRAVIETHELDYPKTVCRNSACMKCVDQGIAFRRVCHDICTLPGAKADLYGSPLLLACTKMKLSSGICKACRHSYKDHAHLYYESVLTQKKLEDPVITEKLRRCTNVHATRETIIMSKKREIQEYTEELKLIQDACICFMEFLSKNSITPYNDAMVPYLNHLIKEEENKCQEKESSTLENLRKQLKFYEEKKDLLQVCLEQQECANSVPIGANVIQEKIEQLRSLKHSGQDVRNALKCVQHTHRQTSELFFEKAGAYVESVCNKSVHSNKTP